LTNPQTSQKNKIKEKCFDKNKFEKKNKKERKRKKSVQVEEKKPMGGDTVTICNVL